MTIFPLIERELAVRARRKATYWSRCVIGLGGMMICLQYLLTPDWTLGPSAAGKPLFDSLAVLAFALCCAACFTTIDSISAETREGTLGLLLLTRVRSFDVILGKLAANGLGMLAMLATLLPLLMLPVLAGGITGGEAFRKGLALLNTAFLCLAIGVCTSAFARETVKALRGTVVWLLVLVFGLAIAPTLSLASPLRTMLLAGDSQYRLSSRAFWVSLLLVHCMAWLFVCIAGKGVRRATRESENRRTVSKARHQILWHGSNSRYSPLEWAVRRERTLKPLLWAGAALLIFSLVFFRILVAWRGFGSLGSFWMLGSWLPQTILGCLSAALFAWAASRFLIESRRTGELELLFTTPLGSQTLLHEHWRVLLLALRWPLLAILLVILLQFAFAVSSMLRNNGGAQSLLLQFAISCAMGILNAIMSVFAITRVGLWFGMRASTQSRAILSSVMLAKGVPCLIWLCWWFLMLAVRLWLRGPASYYYLALLPQAATLLFYLWVFREAKRGLLRALSNPSEEESGPISAMAGVRHDLADAVLKFRGWKVT